MANQADADVKKNKHASIEAANKFLRLIALAEDAVLVALLAAMILVAAAQIILRNLFDMGLAWGDQALRVSVLWLGLIGALAASRDNKHISIDVFLRFLPAPAKVLSQVIVALFTFFVCALVAIHAGRFVYLEYEMGTKAFGNLPAWIIELILPAGFGVIALRYFLLSVAQLKNPPTKEGRR